MRSRSNPPLRETGRPGCSVARGVARPSPRVRDVRPAARGRPRGREPDAGRARRGGRRQDGAAGVPARAGGGLPRGAGRRVSQSEMELAFAGLHQLCAPLLDRLDRLPEPQRDALRDGVRADAGPAPDRFLVGLAVLSLLSEAAEERPLVCVVDDAQWLDRASAQALAFVARRLLAESVALVFAVRDDASEFDGLPELVVEGLRDDDARELLASVHAGPAGRARARADRRRDARQPAGAPGAAARADGGGAGGRLRAAATRCRSRAGSRRASRGGWCALPAGTRRLLLVAAAEPLGDPMLLWRAAERLGIDPGAAAPAVDAGLLELGQRRALPPPARALGGLPGGLARGAAGRAPRAGGGHRSRRSIPIAAPGIARSATPVPDEDVAAELERSAGRAQARGGVAAAAAFLERAAELTPDPARRARARAGRGAGQARGRRARRRAGAAGRGARRDRSTSSSAPAWTCCAGRSRSPPTAAATRPRCCSRRPRGSSRSTPRSRARRTSTRSSRPLYVGRLADDVGVLEVAEAARAASRRSTARPSDLLLDGLAIADHGRLPRRHAAAQRALSAFRAEGLLAAEALRWLWLATPRRARPVGRRELGAAVRAPRRARPRRPVRWRCCRSRSSPASGCTSTPAS